MRLVWGLGLMVVGALLLIQAAPAPSSSTSAAPAAALRLDPDAILRPEELDNPAPAESAYRRALDSTRDPAGRAELLVKLGVLENRLGRRARALEDFLEALRLARQSRSAFAEALALTYSGRVSSDLGDLDAAFSFHNRALETWDRLGSEPGRLRTLQALARLSLQIGEPASAIDHLRKAEEIEPDRAANLHLFGMAFYQGGHANFALGLLRRALDQARLERDAELEALVLADTGSVAASLGQLERAAASLAECLRLSQEKKIPSTEAYARAGRGGVLRLQGRFDEARAELDLADAMFRKLGDPESLAIVLAGKAQLERQRGSLEAALKLSREAVDLTEALRLEVTNPRARASLLSVSSDPYEIQIDVLQRLGERAPGRGFEARAFEVSEQIRARTLYEALAAGGTSRRPGTASLQRERRQVVFDLRELERERLRLLSLSGEEARARLEQINAGLRALLARESELGEKLRRSDPRSALARLEPLRLPQVQSLLDPDMAVLAYTLGRERSFVWWIERGSLTMLEIPARREIEKVAGAIQSILSETSPRRVMRQDPEKVNALLAQLSELVLAPVADRLPRVRRLAVVPDGALQTIPFAALPKPSTAGGPEGKWLVASHVVVNLPSPSTLAALRRRAAERETRPDKTIALIGDPVFAAHDMRLPRSASSGSVQGPELQRLRHSGEEVTRILSFVPEGMGRAILGFDAVPEIIKDPDLRRYRYIHLGTHGEVNSQYPELSGIVLSGYRPDGTPRKNRLLHFYEVYDLDLPADLVSLSTCRSADGPQVRREGPITMTRSFLYAGASRVLGTLWNVGDKQARKLTISFYEGILRDGKTPAEALRDAQNAMRREGMPLREWSAFVLQGDWR